MDSLCEPDCQAHRGCLITGIDSAPSDEEASAADATYRL
jgi:hypothetical protein